ncbi:hypothetical protein MMC26_004704 [Xylographa opegraphella]|nr:hypothetical protein [Xylographa opegraphella]
MALHIPRLGPRRSSSKVRADKVRERETFKYYLPDEPAPQEADSIHGTDVANTLCALPTSSPDTTLMALAQLTALRLKASRAMISVIGKDTQYFIAEATKTLDLVDHTLSEAEGDGLWLGCSNVDKSGRLCEKTIELPLMRDDFACFEVTDLSKDDRFNMLHFVTGAPHFKYYAGTPLTTKKGINIGSLFILDDVVRSPLNREHRRFLGTIAKTIMGHLEIMREAMKRKNGICMSKGLNAFVEGKDWLPRSSRDGRSESSTGYDDLTESQDRHSRQRSNRRQSQRKGMHIDTTTTSSLNPPSQDPRPELFREQGQEIVTDGSQQIGSNGVSPVATSSGYSSISTGSDVRDLFERDPMKPDCLYNSTQRTFVRASCLLRQSLGLEKNGGVLFLDGTIGFRSEGDRALARTTSATEDAAAVFRRTLSLRSFDASEHNTCKDLERSRSQYTSEVSADILAFCTQEAPRGTCEISANSLSFKPLEEAVLHNFLRRYPRGKLWLFDDDGTLPSSSGEAKGALLSTRDSSDLMELKQMEALTIKAHFPGVRQLMLSPLWDANTSRWLAGCFCWTTTSRPQIFSQGTEVSFLKAFCNSVLAEVSRLATLEADRQKGDFISSVSHELRSPLHGILGSAEFLRETSCDAFQTSLIDTIQTCGTTLLDTISHVLDYSKINAFERDLQNGGKQGLTNARSSSQTLLRGATSVLNIYALTDIAAICEEVVEGVYAGQLYQRHASPADGMQGIAEVENQVKIIIDIEKADFNFVTQPGALRRIIMNIFGNALKYTDEGTIEVKLRLEELDTSNADWSDNEENTKNLVITVTDTGKGISSEYIRTRLYTPFAQEDGLVPGTGLGLSITRSIVTMLGGDVEIRSQKGQGTEAEITIPLSYTATNSTSRGGSASKPGNSFSILQDRYHNKVIGLYGFGMNELPWLRDSKTERILKKYISDWYGMKVVSSWLPSTHIDIILVEEEKLPDLMSQGTGLRSLVVLGNSPSASGARTIRELTGGIEYLSKPFGPYKLAKALQLCLEKAESHRDDSTVLEKANAATDSTTTTIEAVINNLHLVDDKVSLSNHAPEQQRNLPTFVITNSVVTPSATAFPARKDPKILLVEDNKINLRLLEAFMRKRKYTDVDTAENGQFAVDAVEQHQGGYDIIFMDISMPVLNGFEATAAIRNLEASRSTPEITPRALIIALTGLASARDQHEAFVCGVDLFMTKPTSFKEMGKLLDDWASDAR